MGNNEAPVCRSEHADMGGNSAADLRFRQLFLSVTGILFILSLVSLLVHSPAGGARSPVMLARWFAVRQDIPVVAGLIFFFSLFGSRVRAVGAAPGAPRGLSLRKGQAIALLIGFALLLWLLRTRVLFDYDLSRDEKMATFDAAIFARGQLFWPVPPFWRDYYDGLNTLYTLPIGDREGWVSGYLPINAAIRMLGGQILPSSLISPLLVLVGGLALWRIACRLWPDSASTQTAVLLLYAGSSQVALTGTTAYAMTTHLTLNLVWLWLFLQRKPSAHVAAIFVGFLATGIHQPLFHPIFVVPFLDLLRREKRWTTLAVYVGCYGAIGLFWLGWPNWISAHGLHPVPSDVDVAGISFVQRFVRGATPLSALSVWTMSANLLRFFTWQHLLLLPLAIVALRSPKRQDPVCRALWQGVLLLVVVMTLILPLQVHGWGYRYLHGFIGSAALIAGYGWHRLEQDGLAPVRAMRWATAISILVLLPVHVWMVRSMIAPFAAASTRLESIPADVVIVDDGFAAFSLDLVLNKADLSNRPIMLSSSKLRADRFGPLCRGRSIAFVDSGALAPLDRFFGQPPLDGPTGKQRQLEDAARAAGCRMTVISR
jgi:hypothetical protein